MLLDLLKPENIGFVNSCRLSKDKIYQMNRKKKTGKSLPASKNKVRVVREKQSMSLLSAGRAKE
jgi:hypothetical protein